jgi:hypothetical protein
MRNEHAPPGKTAAPRLELETWGTAPPDHQLWPKPSELDPGLYLPFSIPIRGGVLLC